MSNGLAKVSEALSRLDSGSDAAKALSGVITAQKSDGTDLLIEEITRRLAAVTEKRKEGVSNADLAPVVKSAAGLLAIAAGNGGEIRVFTKAEFEEYAVEQIGKSADGISAENLATLQSSIDAAGVMFAGDNVSKSFALPVVVVKAEASAEGGEGEGDAPAAGGEGEPAAAAAPAAGGDGTPTPVTDEAKAAADAAAAAAAAAGDGKGEGGEEVETNKGILDDFAGWPSDMNDPSFLKGEEAEAPAFGLDPAAPTE